MTGEEAIRILDPATRLEALREIPVFNRISVDQSACRLAVAALRAQQEPNDPLTLEELREMDGEPVWLVIAGGGRYAVIRSCRETFTEFTDGAQPPNAMYGSYWLAYRRKPEEGVAQHNA